MPREAYRDASACPASAKPFPYDPNAGPEGTDRFHELGMIGNLHAHLARSSRKNRNGYHAKHRNAAFSRAQVPGCTAYTCNGCDRRGPEEHDRPSLAPDQIFAAWSCARYCDHPARIRRRARRDLHREHGSRSNAPAHPMFASSYPSRMRRSIWSDTRIFRMPHLS